MDFFIGARAKQNVGGPFDSISDEILLKIFSNLTQDDLLDSVSLVSRRWQRVSRDPFLWKKLHIDLEKWDTHEALGLIQMATKLQSLTVVSHLTNFPCDSILDSVSNLDTLKLVNVTVEKRDTLVGLVERSGRIRDVHIESCHLDTSHPMDILAPCPYLEALFLDINVPMTLDITLTRQWDRLRSVTFWPGDHPSDMEMYSLARATEGHLQRLSACLAYSWSYTILAQFFQKLESLELTHSKITDHGLLNGVAELPNLRRLFLHLSGELTPSAIKAFFSNDQTRVQLDTLMLCGIAQLDNSCLDTISKCESLTNVELVSCHRITPCGLRALQRKEMNVVAMDCKEIEWCKTWWNVVIHLILFILGTLFMGYSCMEI